MLVAGVVTEVEVLGELDVPVVLGVVTIELDVLVVEVAGVEIGVVLGTVGDVVGGVVTVVVFVAVVDVIVEVLFVPLLFKDKRYKYFALAPGFGLGPPIPLIAFAFFD